MSAAMDEKIHDYLDESLSADEMAELADWIKADPANARQFARIAMVHDRLHCELSALKQDEAEEKIERFPIRWVAAAAAAVALLSVGMNVLSPPKRALMPS